MASKAERDEAIAKASQQVGGSGFVSRADSPRADGHCEACGEYIPLTLAGDPTPHDCGRTPPLGGLLPTIFACPTCHGHAPFAAGCWGSRTHPHEHIFMRPVHELLAGEGLAERLEGTDE